MSGASEIASSVERHGYAMGFHRGEPSLGPLRALQIFWPDKAGNFPFELACDPEVTQLQPRLELAALPSELRAFEREFGQG